MTGPVVTMTTALGGVFHYGIILLVAAGCIYYDFDNYGPTVAIQNGAMSAGIAWILVVPLWSVTESLAGPVFYVFFFCILFVAATLCVSMCGGFPLGVIGAILVILLGLFLCNFAVAFLQGTFGTVIVFLVTYVVVRNIIGLRVQDPATWSYVSQVSKDSVEFREQCDYLKAANTAWEHKYNFDLTVKTLYRIDRPSMSSGALPRQARENTRQLFHGTQWDYAKGIITDGFRLPAHAGMFGRGVYFADCPLKSWRYCFQNKQLSEIIPRTTGKGGLILLCDVALGVTREEKKANKELAGFDRSSWRAWFTRERGAYDSVVGVTEEAGGALRVPEYVVYNPDQVRMIYMFEVSQIKKGHAPVE